MSNETLFWGFIDDLKILSDDISALVEFGGCRWGEPSPIPDVVERLSKLDYKEIENIFPMVIFNDMTKIRLKNEVSVIRYIEKSKLSDFSDEKVAIYIKSMDLLVSLLSKIFQNPINCFWK